ncbi:hypothetical protein [Splendidivirga corallicola]|uniref:hypothetical protein n=1 Tax=Splendidivirga corallicola TaxID=3051826 RepID=UPI003211C9E2
MEIDLELLDGWDIERTDSTGFELHLPDSSLNIYWKIILKSKILNGDKDSLEQFFLYSQTKSDGPIVEDPEKLLENFSYELINFTGTKAIQQEHTSLGLGPAYKKIYLIRGGFGYYFEYQHGKIDGQEPAENHYLKYSSRFFYTLNNNTKFIK